MVVGIFYFLLDGIKRGGDRGRRCDAKKKTDCKKARIY